MHVIRVDGAGRVRLIPCSSWHFEGSHDPATWTVRATAYGPSTSTTWNLPASAVVFVRWGSTPGQPYVGTGPTSWAHTTARPAIRGRAIAGRRSGRAAGAIVDLSRGPGYRLRRRRRSAGEAPGRDRRRARKGGPGGVDRWRFGRGPGERAATGLGSAPSWAEPARCAGQGRRLGLCPECSPRADAHRRCSTIRMVRRNARRCGNGTSPPCARWRDSSSTNSRRSSRRRCGSGLIYTTSDLAGRAQAFQKLVAGGVAVNEALATSGLLADAA